MALDILNACFAGVFVSKINCEHFISSILHYWKMLSLSPLGCMIEYLKIYIHTRVCVCVARMMVPYVIPVLEKHRRIQMYRANLGYIARPCLQLPLLLPPKVLSYVTVTLIC